MKRLLDSIQAISENCRNVAVLYSCGRDSTVMLDLFCTHAKKSIGEVIFMYFCPELSYEEKILTYQEKRYGIEIARIAHPDCAYMVNDRTKKRKVKISDLERSLRDRGAEWIAYGFRKDESLQRRGQLTLTEDGVDYKYRKVFPIAEWAKRHAAAYCKQRRLLLPPEYNHASRDINSFKGDAVLYIYHNYPDDYKRIIKMYPDVEGELMRALAGGAT